MWSYQVLPLDHLPRSAFEFHVVSVTLPFKNNIVVIYRHYPDSIPSPLLQNISHDILQFLTTVIKSSITSGIIPAPFKIAAVMPLLKKPTLDSAAIRNTRPVSLHSFLSKTMEHAVYNQLSSYLSENYLLDPKSVRLQDCLLHWDSPPHGEQVAWCRQSLVLLVSPHSPQLIFCVWHSQPPNPPLHSGLTWHCLTNCTFQVTWNISLFKPMWPERCNFHDTRKHSGNWCSSRLSIRTASVFTTH